MAKSIEDIEKFIGIAEEMLERNEMDVCINRLYIASENIAHLVLKKFSAQIPKSHDKAANAIENLFNAGKLDRNFSIMMRRLYSLHMLSDYGREIEEGPTKEELGSILKEARGFLEIPRNI